MNSILLGSALKLFLGCKVIDIEYLRKIMDELIEITSRNVDYDVFYQEVKTLCQREMTHASDEEIQQFLDLLIRPKDEVEFPVSNIEDFKKLRGVILSEIEKYVILPK